MMFERFGGDPMKRSVVNQMASQLLMAGFLSNNLYLPILTFRTLYGPLHHYIAMIGIVECVAKILKADNQFIKEPVF